MLPLRELQSQFFRAIAYEPGKSHDFDPILVQTGQERGPLSVEERVNIYAQMYVAGLLDALYEDFPRVAAYLGFERFRDLVRAYLRIYPSTHPVGHHSFELSLHCAGSQHGVSKVGEGERDVGTMRIGPKAVRDHTKRTL